MQCTVKPWIKSLYNFSGESSSGKSSLVNLILGEELLPSHVLNSTSTICEVRFGYERRLIAHPKYSEELKTRPVPEIHPLKTKEECGKNYIDQIAFFVQMKSEERQKGSKYTRVEIFWPHELLKVNLYFSSYHENLNFCAFDNWWKCRNLK